MKKNFLPVLGTQYSGRGGGTLPYMPLRIQVIYGTGSLTKVIARDTNNDALLGLSADPSLKPFKKTTNNV